MAEPGWIGNGIRIGWFEFTRTVRALRTDSARLVLTGAGVVVPGMLLGAVVFLFADAIGSVGEVGVPDPVRGTIAVFWGFGVYIVAQRTISQGTRIDGDAMVLTTVSPRSATLGLVLAEALRASSYLTVPALVLAGTFVFVFEALASVLFVPLAVGLFAVTVSLTGTTLGMALALLVARSSVVARHRTVLGTLAVLVVFGSYFLALGVIGEVNTAVAAGLPVAWFVDLAVIGSPIVGSVPRAIGVCGLSVGLFVLVGALITRLTTALWFEEPVSTRESNAEAETIGNDLGGDRPRSVTSGDRVGAALGGFDRPTGVVSGSVRQVARMALLRTRREPRRLTFLLTPIVAVGIGVLNAASQSGIENVLGFAAIGCALFGPWFAGAAFGLNPLGEEGAVLPTTLLAIDPRSYVNGLIAPGLAFGLPLVVGLVVASGIAGGYEWLRLGGLLAIAFVLTVVASAVAPAIGMRLARFSAISVGRSREVLPPSLLAVIGYSIVVFGIGGTAIGAWVAPALVRVALVFVCTALPGAVFEWIGAQGIPTAATVSWFGRLGEAIGSVSPAVVRVAVPASALLVGLVVAELAYRNAVQRFRGYQIGA